MTRAANKYAKRMDFRIAGSAMFQGYRCAAIDGRQKFEHRYLFSLKGYSPSALTKVVPYRHDSIEHNSQLMVSFFSAKRIIHCYFATNYNLL
jgi:hypothetical protein